MLTAYALKRLIIPEMMANGEKRMVVGNVEKEKIVTEAHWRSWWRSLRTKHHDTKGIRAILVERYGK